jgi:hypothetical protein
VAVDQPTVAVDQATVAVDQATVAAAASSMYMWFVCVRVFRYRLVHIHTQNIRRRFGCTHDIHVTYLLKSSQKYESQPDTDIVGMGLKGVSVCLVETNIAEHLMQEHQLSLVDMPHGHES